MEPRYNQTRYCPSLQDYTHLMHRKTWYMICGIQTSARLSAATIKTTKNAQGCTYYMPGLLLIMIKYAVNVTWICSLDGSKLFHPFHIFLQVFFAHRFADFLAGQLKVGHAGWKLEFFFGDGSNLVWCEALDTTTHGHHGGIPGKHSRRGS